MPPIIGTAEHQLCAPSGVGGAVSRRGVSRQYTWVLLGELPPSSGGCRPPTLPALGLILPGSKQLHLPVGLQPPQIPHGGWGSHGGGGGVALPTGVEQELPLVGTALALSRAQGAHLGPTGGVAAGHVGSFNQAIHGAAPCSVAKLPGQGSWLHPACLDLSGCFGRMRSGTVPSKNTAVISGRRKAAPLHASASPPSMGLSCRAVLRAQGATGTSAGRETITSGGEAEAWQPQTGNHHSPRWVGPQT